MPDAQESPYEKKYHWPKKEVEYPPFVLVFSFLFYVFCLFIPFLLGRRSLGLGL